MWYGSGVVLWLLRDGTASHMVREAKHTMYECTVCGMSWCGQDATRIDSVNMDEAGGLSSESP